MNIVLAATNTSDVVSIPQALVHTVISMGIVFSVLILISFVIWLLKYTNKANRKSEKTDAVETKKAVLNSSNDKTTQDKAEDDKKLVAAIAGAIAMYMSEETGSVVEPDGLIIRSIKKRNF